MADKKDFHIQLIIEPILAEIKKITEPIEQAGEKAGKAMEDSAKKVQKALESALQATEKTLDSLVNKLLNVSSIQKDIMNSITTGVAKLLTGGGGVASGASSLVAGGAGEAASVMRAMAGNTALLTTIAGAIGVIAAVLAAIKILLDIFFKIVEPIFEALNAGIGQIIEILSIPMQMIAAVITKNLVPFFEMAMKLSTMMINYLSAYEAKYQEIYARRLLENPDNPIGAQVGASYEASFLLQIAPILGGIADIFAMNIFNIIDIVVWLGTSLLGAIGLIPGLGDAAEKASDELTAFAEALKTGLTDEIDNFKEVTLPNLAEAIGDLAGDAASAAETLANEFLGSPVLSDEEAVNIAGTEEYWDSLKETTEDLGTDMAIVTKTLGLFDIEVINLDGAMSDTLDPLRTFTSNTKTAADSLDGLSVSAGELGSALDILKNKLGGGTGFGEDSTGSWATRGSDNDALSKFGWDSGGGGFRMQINIPTIQ